MEQDWPGAARVRPASISDADHVIPDALSHLLEGGHSESVSTGVDVHSKREPLVMAW